MFLVGPVSGRSEVLGRWVVELLQADWLAEQMREHNFTVACMHGQMPQEERDTIMKDFRGGKR